MKKSLDPETQALASLAVKTSIPDPVAAVDRAEAIQAEAYHRTHPEERELADLQADIESADDLFPAAERITLDEAFKYHLSQQSSSSTQKVGLKKFNSFRAKMRAEELTQFVGLLPATNQKEVDENLVAIQRNTALIEQGKDVSREPFIPSIEPHYKQEEITSKRAVDRFFKIRLKRKTEQNTRGKQEKRAAAKIPTSEILKKYASDKNAYMPDKKLGTAVVRNKKRRTRAQTKRKPKPDAH